MYNEKSKNNLINLNERTAEERTAIAKAGIKASIESKKEKKKFKDYFNSLLEEKKELIRNGKKTKITKKEYIACKLIDILTSDREFEYKDIQAIKLLLEIIDEKPIESLVNINNQNNQNNTGITIIDDVFKYKEFRELDLQDSIYIINSRIKELKEQNDLKAINKLLEDIQK